MTAQPVRVTRAEGVTHIELHRPHVGNALDAELMNALIDAIAHATSDDGTAIAVTGAGARFCVGGDLAYFANTADPAAYLADGARKLGDALTMLSESGKPVIVGVHGAVAGAGLALMLSGDVIIAGAGTTFTTGYVKVGLTPDCGVSWLLRQSVGPHRAADLLITSRIIDAETAERWGLVTRVADDADVHDATLAVARKTAGGISFAVNNARRLVHASADSSRGAIVADEAQTIAAAIGRDEATTAIASFLSR